MNVLDGINMQDYAYDLPDYRIAAFPADKREIQNFLCAGMVR